MPGWEVFVLGEMDVTATIAVKDLEAARAFYVEKLGMHEGARMGDQALELRSGINPLLLYVSKFAGTNQATAATWSVPDVDAVVRYLRERGVRFEHYDLPGMTREGDVHVGEGVRNAWFKDPDGNILSVVGRPVPS
jgi:catechol 2,3-dioxygenase-like lactoylglutathione lyase family enzyme